PEAPIRLHADPVRVCQILSNLLNNAAKYTDKGGRIELSARAQENNAVITVRDTGAGIATDLLPHIFEPFTQLASTLDDSQGGLGIGLTLVRQLVELHHGTVEAHSDGPNEGARFVVTIPLTASHHRAVVPAAHPLAPSSTDPRRILVVDDDTDTAKTLTFLLEKTGHEVRFVHDGVSAVTEVE